MTPGEQPSKILVIEDDDAIADVVLATISKIGAVGARAANGRDGLKLFFEDRADLVVLDVGLPSMDGWEVLERIRDLSDAAILMLTARDLEKDKVRGLQGGADDYLTKPFSVRELGARIEALLRRQRSSAGATSQTASVLVDGNLEVDWAARQARVDGVEVDLTPLEFRLLDVFVRHPGQALSSDQLLRLVWDDPYGTSPDRVKFTVLRLRKKLGWTESETDRIEAVRGYGYRYRAAG